MKILAFYPYVPYPLNRGAYHRAYHLLKGLAREHEVDLFALAENGEGAEHAEAFHEFCHSVTVVPFQHPAWDKLFPKRLMNPLPATIAHWSIPKVQAELDRVLATRKYDAVHVLDLVLVQFLMGSHRHIPLVLDRTRVDLQYQLMEHGRLQLDWKQRILNYENYLKLWRYERLAARRCAMQVVCGPDDLEFTRRYISRSVPVEVIPNGVDLEYFHPHSSDTPRATDPTVIFCGAMDYTPNVDALRWYFAEMHSEIRKAVPNLRVLLVGKDPSCEVKIYSTLPGVTVTGGVPDVRPYYKQAWIQIVPLRIGGGTRLKIVESLGMGTPVVSTTIGAQGLFLKQDFDILYGDTSDEFVIQTIRALKDLELRARLETNGIESVRSRLSWNKLGQDLNDGYFQHVSGSRARTGNARSPLSRPAVTATLKI